MPDVSFSCSLVRRIPDSDLAVELLLHKEENFSGGVAQWVEGPGKSSLFLLGRHPAFLYPVSKFLVLFASRAQTYYALALDGAKLFYDFLVVLREAAPPHRTPA